MIIATMEPVATEPCSMCARHCLDRNYLYNLIKPYAQLLWELRYCERVEDGLCFTCFQGDDLSPGSPQHT